MEDTTSFSSVIGSGEVAQGQIKSVGEVVGPFGMDVHWVPECSYDERSEAEQWIAEAMRGLSEEDPDAIPMAIESITIRRV